MNPYPCIQQSPPNTQLNCYPQPPLQFQTTTVLPKQQYLTSNAAPSPQLPSYNSAYYNQLPQPQMNVTYRQQQCIHSHSPTLTYQQQQQYMCNQSPTLAPQYQQRSGTFPPYFSLTPPLPPLESEVIVQNVAQNSVTKSVRIRPIFADQSIVVPELVVVEDECSSIKGILRLTKKYLRKHGINMSKRPILKYSPSGKYRLEEMISDDELECYIKGSEEPMLCVCEVPGTEYFIDMENIIDLIGKQSVRNSAICMATSKELSDMIIEVLKSEEMSQELNNFVKKVVDKVDEKMRT